MPIEPHSKLKNHWIIRYYPEGRKKDTKTGKPGNKRERIIFEGTEEEARLQLRQLSRQNKAIPLVSARTIESAWDEFLCEYKTTCSTSTYRDIKSAWKNHLKPYFGHFRPCNLTVPLIEQYKARRLEEHNLREKDEKKKANPKKRTVTKELSYLSTIINWMCDPQRGYADPLPFSIKGFPPKQTKAPLPRVPSRREIVLLLRRAERQYRPIFAACYYAGLRKSEASKLRGIDINLSQGYMVIRGKGDKERVVPIFRKLRVYIRANYRTGLLWANPDTDNPYHDFRKPLKRAAEKAGIEQWVYLHLLRHSFGTHAIMAGIGERAVQMLMGHSSILTTQIYTTLAGQFLSSEMDKFGSGALHQKKKKASLRIIKGNQKRADNS